MKNCILSLFFLTAIGIFSVTGQEKNSITSIVKDVIKPIRTEIIMPIHKTSFNNDGTCKERKQGGNPREISGYFVFDASMDGNRQVDPQIAVGGGYILHGSNKGLIIYNKKGECIEGVSRSCFNEGIDPKLFFDTHNQVFGFDLWNPWDKEKKKPVNISISETNNPTGAWNTYPIPAPKGVDGGGIGYSKKWIGYSFPGGENRTFVLKMEEAKLGKPGTIYHFPGNLGHPIAMQDAIDDLYFFEFTPQEFIIRRIVTSDDGSPVCEIVAKKAHGLKYTKRPPKSEQKGTEQLTASGDRKPKNLVFQNGDIWFSQTVNVKGRAGIQWHQVKTGGTIVQTGLISSKKTNYIQTTLAVNKNNDVLIGFQETNKNIYISPRFTFRKATDRLGTTRKIVNIGNGKGFTDGATWGDYSGSIIDGDNLTDLWSVQSITDENGKGDTVIVKVPFK